MIQLFRFVHLLIFAVCISLCSAQSSYAPPKISAKAEKELDEAILLSQGGRPEEAIEKIEGLISKNPDWTTPRQQLSRIYYKAGQKQAAIDQLEASLRIDTLSQVRELYSLGRIYEEINLPQKALNCYEAVMKSETEDQSLIQKATTSFEFLNSKKKLWETKENIIFRPFTSDINTPNHESLGRWTLDGQRLVFTRMVYEQEDIFFATFDSTTRAWKIEDFPHNTPQNEGAHAVSPDGKYLIFTSCNRQDGLGSCDLYLSQQQKGKWSEPENMGTAFNSEAWDGHPCFGLDGLSLFFSSGRPGGMGGRDIWYVYQIAAGKWSKPINAGPAINTADDEESPFVHFDGQTLYFMRDGKEGLGGYDLYISRKGIDGKWQDAENLGAPINSGADEGALTLHPDGRRAIITRVTPGAKNDLFEFELPEKYRAEPLQALHVTITDFTSGLPVRARLELFEISKQDTIRLSQWADPEGKLAVVTRQNISYGLMAAADGYMMYSGHLDSDTTAVREIEIKMIPMASAEEKVIVLQNVFFETASSTLLSSSETELNKLLWTLRKNPEMKMEIRGHTDDVGDEQVNQTLSEARAKSVYDYLTGRGIDKARLSYVGFGESIPVVDNATEAGRKQNRRTEFKVIGQ